MSISRKKSYLTLSSSQTKKLGGVLAKKILTPRRFFKKGDSYKNRIKNEEGQKKALVIGLEGDLGGGKTTFLQGLAKGLGIKQRITSPTFVIMRRYKVESLSFKNFYHIDCYRIEGPKELLDLGFKKIISSPQNIVAVEWADRIRKIMPKFVIWINFGLINRNTRKIMLR